MKKKLLFSALTFGLLTTPLAILAMTLGNLQTKSYLNQTMNAEIPIINSNGVPAANIIVQTAPDKAYRELGLTPPGKIPPFVFKVVDQGKGPMIQISTKDPVADPIIYFLLQVNVQGQTIYRDYSILLDPAPAGTTAAPKVKTMSSSQTNPAASLLPNFKNAPATPANSAQPQAIKQDLNTKTSSVAKPNTSAQTADTNSTDNNSVSLSDANPDIRPVIAAKTDAAFNPADIKELRDKLMAANQLLTSLQQKNEFLTLRLQDMQTQVGLLQTQLSNREKKLISLEAQLNKYKSLPNQLSVLSQEVEKQKNNQNQNSWFSLQGLLLLLCAGAISFLFYIYSFNKQLAAKISNFSWNDLLSQLKGYRQSKSIAAAELATKTMAPSEQPTEISDTERTEPTLMTSGESAESTSESSRQTHPEDDSFVAHDIQAPIENFAPLENAQQPILRTPLDSPHEEPHHDDESLSQNSNQALKNENNIETDPSNDDVLEFELGDLTEKLNQAPTHTEETPQSTPAMNKAQALWNEKIDLALAYMEFHDLPSAKELLEDVIANADESLKIRARELLGKMTAKV